MSPGVFLMGSRKKAQRQSANSASIKQTKATACSRSGPKPRAATQSNSTVVPSMKIGANCLSIQTIYHDTGGQNSLTTLEPYDTSYPLRVFMVNAGNRDQPTRHEDAKKRKIFVRKARNYQSATSKTLGEER